MRGDQAYFYVYDAEGNYQTNVRLLSTVSAIVARPNWNSIAGYWGNPGAYLTVTLKDSGGAPKATSNDMADTDDGEFYVYMSSAIVPGDIVEVTDWYHHRDDDRAKLDRPAGWRHGAFDGYRGQRKPADATLRLPA